MCLHIQRADNTALCVSTGRTPIRAGLRPRCCEWEPSSQFQTARRYCCAIDLNHLVDIQLLFKCCAVFTRILWFFRSVQTCTASLHVQGQIPPSPCACPPHTSCKGMRSREATHLVCSACHIYLLLFNSPVFLRLAQCSPTSSAGLLLQVRLCIQHHSNQARRLCPTFSVTTTHHQSSPGTAC